MFKRPLSLLIIFAFVLTSIGPLCPVPCSAAVDGLGLPAPGTMVNLSPAYQPVIIRGLTVHKDNPFLFDFIVDTGQDHMSGEPLKKEGEKLIKYFLASLSIPDKDVWVNLSPYEKDKIIPEVLGRTGMGRDLLEEDYILKQVTASLIYPERQLGKTFWDTVYAKARAMYGTTQIPVNTFNKVWIMADRAQVYEHGQTAFVVDSHLKVMLQEDYLALKNHEGAVAHPQGAKQSHSLVSQIVRQIILPQLEKEVNTGKNFAKLRQIFNSIILANWYKRNLKQALLNQVYADKAKIKGINLNDPNVKERIYEQYLKAYKKGVFNYIQEDINASDGAKIPRKYFSGGINEGMAADPAMTHDAAALAASLPRRTMVDFMTEASPYTDRAMSHRNAVKTKTDYRTKTDLEYPSIEDQINIIAGVRRSVMEHPPVKGQNSKYRIRILSAQFLEKKSEKGYLESLYRSPALEQLREKGYALKKDDNGLYLERKIISREDLLRIFAGVLGKLRRDYWKDVVPLYGEGKLSEKDVRRVSYPSAGMGLIKDAGAVFDNGRLLTSGRDIQQVIGKNAFVLWPADGQKNLSFALVFTGRGGAVLDAARASKPDAAMTGRGKKTHPLYLKVQPLFSQPLQFSDAVARVPGKNGGDEIRIKRESPGSYLVQRTLLPGPVRIENSQDKNFSFNFAIRGGQFVIATNAMAPDSVKFVFEQKKLEWGPDQSVKEEVTTKKREIRNLSLNHFNRLGGLSNGERIEINFGYYTQKIVLTYRDGSLFLEKPFELSSRNSISFERKDGTYILRASAHSHFDQANIKIYADTEFSYRPMLPGGQADRAMTSAQKRVESSLQDLIGEGLGVIHPEILGILSIPAVLKGGKIRDVESIFVHLRQFVPITQEGKMWNSTLNDEEAAFLTWAVMIRDQTKIEKLLRNFYGKFSLGLNRRIYRSEAVFLTVAAAIRGGDDAAGEVENDFERFVTPVEKGGYGLKGHFASLLTIAAQLMERKDIQRLMDVYDYWHVKKQQGPEVAAVLSMATVSKGADIENGEHEIKGDFKFKKKLSLDGREVELNEKARSFLALACALADTSDAAMTGAPFVPAMAAQNPGGIDLSTSGGMQWKIRKDGAGVEMNIDPAMAARIRARGIDGLSPVIFKITPVTDVWVLAGLKAPA
ncbi:MAG: hypothetical protein KGJ61_04995 [Candidatus Omnitrophica bacterium]|nr:hypothetical protein [Candidatus Omnitrophota bacterium]